MAERKISCLIIEDEPIAAEVLKDYINEVTFLDLKAVCKDAIYAMEFLESQNIDLIFLDIHLPKIKGLDFLKTLRNRPQVILTTAYHQYAIDAFDEGVVDYLLKPIEFSRFLKAVNKLKIDEPLRIERLSEVPNKDYHFFTVNKKKVRVYFDDILYIESLKDYSRIHTRNRTLVVRSQIGKLTSVLDTNKFVRIHQSFVVAVQKIESYTSTSVDISGSTIPIGRSYRSKISDILN